MIDEQTKALVEQIAGLTMAVGLIVNELGNTVPGFADRIGLAIDGAIAGLKPEYQASGSATVLLHIRSIVDAQLRQSGAPPPESH